MALFRYKAITPAGEVLQGEMEAGSETEVIGRLQEAGNLPVAATPASSGFSGSLQGLLRGRNQLNSREVMQFTQQLSTLLGAGLPLDRALTVQVELAEREVFAKRVGAIRDEVRGGASLSTALEGQHGVFSKLYVNMVRAGEAGGTLDQTLSRLSEYLERSKELKDSVVSAMIYPIILVFMAIASLMILLVFVVPKFTPIFEEMGGDLPLLTVIVLGVGRVLQNYWWALLLLAGGVIWFARRQYADPPTRRRIDALLLKTRYIGDLLAKMDTARLSRTVGTLIDNGVPLLGSLAIGRKVVNNTVLAEAVEEASEEVKTGGSLGYSLARSKKFPKLAVQMIAVGDETGQLDEMLLKVADAYDVEVRTTIDRLLALFVPVTTLLLAGLIALIVLSILMAILSVNDQFL